MGIEEWRWDDELYFYDILINTVKFGSFCCQIVIN